MVQRGTRRMEGLCGEIAFVREALLPLGPGVLGDSRVDPRAIVALDRRVGGRKHRVQEIDLPFESENAQEVFDLVKAYAIQETTVPLKGIGTYLKFGVPGYCRVDCNPWVISQTSAPVQVSSNFSNPIWSGLGDAFSSRRP